MALVLFLTFLSTIASVIQATKAFYPTSVPGTMASLSSNASSSHLITVTSARTISTYIVISDSQNLRTTPQSGISQASVSLKPTETQGITQNETATGETVSPGWRRGYVRPLNSRGTFDILWSCMFILSICAYSAVRLNSASRKETYRSYGFRKLKWCVMAILAPELVLSFAWAQKQEAKLAQRKFKMAGFPSWTIELAFYANMGGFVLQPSNSRPFPVNSKQILYLVKNGYFDYPTTNHPAKLKTRRSLGFHIFLITIQVIWFLTQLLGRAVIKLTITALELSTLVGMLFAWPLTFSGVGNPLMSDLGKSVP